MSEVQLDMSERTLITRADFAKRKDVSRAAVTIAVGAGRLHGPALGPGKKLVLPFADLQWKDRTGEDGAKIARDEDETDAKADDTGALRQEKLTALQLKNERTRLELDVERGSLVSMAEIGEALARMGGDIAQQLEGIAGWATELAAVPHGNVQAMRAALKDHVRKLRGDIVERLAKLKAESADDDDGE